MKPLDADEVSLRRIGRDLLGPALSLFVLHVLDECARRGIRHVYYLAREGYLLRRIHQELARRVLSAEWSKGIATHYLYVSRVSTSLAAVDRFDAREVRLARERKPPGDVAACFRMFGLDYADFSDLFPEIPGNSGTAEIERIFHDSRVNQRMLGARDRARIRLRAYLAQEGFFEPDGTRALVDIGWSGTIQINISRAFRDDPDFPKVVGFYFGRAYWHDQESRCNEYLAFPKSEFEPGYFYDQRRRSWLERSVMNCVEIFENSAAAPHGTTLGYELVGDTVRPELKESSGKLTRIQELLQEGILDYARWLAANLERLRPELGSLKRQASRRLARLIRRPTLSEARALGALTHSEDWGSESSRDLIDRTLTASSMFHPGEFRRGLARAFWKEGTIRHSRLPAGVPLLLLGRWVRWLLYDVFGLVSRPSPSRSGA